MLRQMVLKDGQICVTDYLSSFESRTFVGLEYQQLQYSYVNCLVPYQNKEVLRYLVPQEAAVMMIHLRYSMILRQITFEMAGV